MTPVILTYHHIAEPPPGHSSENLFVTPENFASQMQFLKKKNYAVISLDELRDHLSGKKKAPRGAVI